MKDNAYKESESPYQNNDNRLIFKNSDHTSFVLVFNGKKGMRLNTDTDKQKKSNKKHIT